MGYVLGMDANHHQHFVGRLRRYDNFHLKSNHSGRYRPHRVILLMAATQKKGGWIGGERAGSSEISMKAKRATLSKINA